MLNVQKFSLFGNYNYENADQESDSFINNGKTLLFIKNNGEHPVSMQFLVQGCCPFGHRHELIVTVNPSEEKIIGVFDKHIFNADDKVIWIYLADSRNTQLAAISI